MENFGSKYIWVLLADSFHKFLKPIPKPPIAAHWTGGVGGGRQRILGGRRRCGLRGAGGHRVPGRAVCQAGSPQGLTTSPAPKKLLFDNFSRSRYLHNFHKPQTTNYVKYFSVKESLEKGFDFLTVPLPAAFGKIGWG